MRLQKILFIFINKIINKIFNLFSFAKDFIFVKNFVAMLIKINYKKISKIIYYFLIYDIYSD